MSRRLPPIALARDGTSAAAGRAASLPPEMLDVRWELVSLQVSGQPAEDVAGAGLTITFTPDGKIHGSGGCNRYFGGYTGDGEGKLAISPLGSTRMACPPPIAEREHRYLQALPEVRGYALDGATHLHLRFDQPDLLLVCARQPAASPTTGGGAGAGGAQRGE